MAATAAYQLAADALAFAKAELLALGFETVGISDLGDAEYLGRPGKTTRVRLATYAHTHPDTVDVTITPAMIARIGHITDAEIRALVSDAVAAVDQAEAEGEAEEGLSLEEIAEMTPAQVERALRGEG